MPALEGPQDEGDGVEGAVELAVAAAIFGYKALNPKPGADAQATAPVPAIQPLKLGTIAFKPCTLSSATSRDSLEAQCATFEVPEDRTNPGGRKLALNIA